MARPREFDEDDVIERALEVFWTQGYEATSLTDLMEATGLAKGSVYKGFGDKKSFFLRTLDAYLERGRGRLELLAASNDSPSHVLREWLRSVVDMATCTGVRRGCFATNCSVELAPHDDEVRARLTRHHRILEKILADIVSAGVAKGELKPDLDPRDGARWINTVIAGLQVIGKTGTSRKDALAMVDLAMSALEL